MPCSDWRIFAYISLYQIFIKHCINNSLPPSNYRILRIVHLEVHCYTHHMCLRVHLNICVSEKMLSVLWPEGISTARICITFDMCALCMDFTPASYMYKFVYTFFFWHSLSAPSPSRIAAGI